MLDLYRKWHCLQFKTAIGVITCLLLLSGELCVSAQVSEPVRGAIDPMTQLPLSVTLDQPIDLHLRRAPLMLVLGMLSVEKDIPIGIEFSPDEKNKPKLEIDVKNAPLIDVLNLITQQEPAYVWELRDGVINFIPARDRDPFFEKLLNTPVREFVSPKGNNKFAIRDALLDLPDINKLIAASGVEADRLGYPHKPSIYANDADLSDKNTDFRSLLNKIIRESEHNSWILKWGNKKEKLFELGL